MSYVIQHPAREDLFFDGQEWGTLASAKRYPSELMASFSAEICDRVILMPDAQPLHPITQTP